MPLTLDELAIRIPASIQVFEKYGLDYYQKGTQTLREACESAGIPFREIDQELSHLQEETLTLEDMSADRLIDYLNGRYHAGEKELLRSIHGSIRRLIKTCEGDHKMRLLLIEPLFRRLKIQLTAHCKKEDELFFPWMRKLTALHRNRALHTTPGTIGFIRNPVIMLESEHMETIDLLVAIKQAAGNFMISSDDPVGYSTLMNDLQTLESDLHMHLHIENNILFPRLLLLEEELTKQLKL